MMNNQIREVYIYIKEMNIIIQKEIKNLLYESSPHFFIVYFLFMDLIIPAPTVLLWSIIRILPSLEY